MPLHQIMNAEDNETMMELKAEFDKREEKTWRPQPKQEEVLLNPAFEKLIG